MRHDLGGVLRCLRIRLAAGHTPARVAFRRPWPGTTRGLILWLNGLAFIFIGGVQYLGTEVPSPTRQYLALALDHAPQWVFGIMFVTSGGLACFSAYCHFDRDKLGYRLAAITAGGWSAVYASGCLFYHAGLRSLGAAVPWLLFACILIVCAGLPKLPFDFARRP